MTDAELADEIEGAVVRRRKSGYGTQFYLDDQQWHQIIAALRRQPPETLKAAYFEGYEDALKDRQPSSDQVLVPREPTGSMLEAAEEIDARCRAGFLGIGASIGMVYRAMLAAAEAEGRNS